ncbi:MAG: type II secretion system F family protein, partial [Bacilli bacterium]|nr:type II secretion system F family protein [Bacilli bacterium]
VNNCTIFKNSMDIISSKLNVALLFLTLALIAHIINLSSISFFKLLIPFIIGFTIPDLLYFIKYKKYVNDIENDLLQAIIIMNNAFKSGRSITQAIDLVASELSGPISDEFKKIGIELSSGLDLSVSFKRFANRINVEEVTYLTASLSILNKTGGNIIKVFSSIEHSLFMKKKLNLELRSLTSSSKIIIKVLFLVPLLFVLFVSLITPTYFMPFINTEIGLIILLFMIIYYIIYIVVVSKIMKVRM